MVVDLKNICIKHPFFPVFPALSLARCAESVRNLCGKSKVRKSIILKMYKKTAVSFETSGFFNTR